MKKKTIVLLAGISIFALCAAILTVMKTVVSHRSIQPVLAASDNDPSRPVMPKQSAPDIPWPPGWKMADGAISWRADDEAPPGSVLVATKVGASGIEGIITLMQTADQADRADRHTARIDNALKKITDAFVNGYPASAHAQCSNAIPDTLGGRAALSASCNSALARQFAVVALSDASVYALVYTAPPEYFDRYRPDFDAMKTRLPTP